MSDELWQNDKWNISPMNFRPEARDGLMLRHPIEIADCTLREGEQQAGVALQVQEKVEIARALDELGIHQIEAAMPAVAPEEREALEQIAKAGLKARILAVVRSMKYDVDIAAESGAWGVVLSLPVGELQIKHKLRWSEEKILETAVEMSNYAHTRGLYVVLSPYDTTRGDLDFLHRYLTTAYQYGHVDRLRVVDTVGCATPEAMRFLVRRVRETIPVPIEVHGHDDFGLATANIISGLMAGGSVASTSWFGIGERAGNAATEEVAVALRVLYGIDLGLRWERIQYVSELVARHTRVQMHPHKAVTGGNAFSQISGLVVAGYLENPFTGLSYRGQFVGRDEPLYLGKASGKASIEKKLADLGMHATGEQIDELLGLVKNEGIHTKAIVPDHRFREFVQQVLGR